MTVRRKRDAANLNAGAGLVGGQGIWLAQMQPLANGSKHFQLANGLQIRMHDVGPLDAFAFNEVGYNERYLFLRMEYLSPKLVVFRRGV